jgi:MSHA biogenesis protein MshM
MYLEHFQFKEYPFALTPNVDFFVRLTSHQSALNVLLLSLENGEGFIKIIGEVGTGKTLLCRKLLHVLDERGYVTAYIPNPNLETSELYQALARELEISVKVINANNNLLSFINDKLIELYKENKKVVLIVDESQALSDENLEALRLISNLETPSSKLIQIVLFAQPELDQRLKSKKLRQLTQRISFSYYLKSVPAEELKSYLGCRLKAAGLKNFSEIFSPHAYYLLYKASNGVPRLINLLCHKALLLSYGMGLKKVNGRIMLAAIKDTESVSKKYLLSYCWNVAVIILGLVAYAEIYYFLWIHL